MTKAKIYPTEGRRLTPMVPAGPTDIEAVEGATLADAANAFCLDIQRRVAAGELTAIFFVAHDTNGDVLHYRHGPMKPQPFAAEAGRKAA